MNNQNHEKSHALTGAHNRRLDKTVQSDSQSTAAWAQAGLNTPKANVSIPDNNAVNNAKEWVDNGSRL